MKTLSILLLVSVLLGSCALSSMQKPAIDADGDYLVGTWISSTSLHGYREIEVFLPTMVYCSYSNPVIKTADSIGTWHISSPGIVGVQITSSVNPNEVTSGDVSQISIIKRIEPDKLLMGAPCSHCEGGIAGGIYTRYKLPKSSCNMSTK